MTLQLYLIFMSHFFVSVLRYQFLQNFFCSLCMIKTHYHYFFHLPSTKILISFKIGFLINVNISLIVHQNVLKKSPIFFPNICLPCLAPIHLLLFVPASSSLNFVMAKKRSPSDSPSDSDSGSDSRSESKSKSKSPSPSPSDSSASADSRDAKRCGSTIGLK